MIQNGLEGMFTEVNDKVGTIAGQVGQTPQGWNSGVFNLIQNLSQTVIVPIAGLIITFVLCYELITMVTQKNNFHEFETYNIFLWIFKAYIAIYLVTNTFNITMAVFDVGQHIVNGAAGVISSDTALDAAEAVAALTDSLEEMEVGELFLLAMETLLIISGILHACLCWNLCCVGKFHGYFNQSAWSNVFSCGIYGRFGILAI